MPALAFLDEIQALYIGAPTFQPDRGSHSLDDFLQLFAQWSDEVVEFSAKTRVRLEALERAMSSPVRRAAADPDNETFVVAFGALEDMIETVKTFKSACDERDNFMRTTISRGLLALRGQSVAHARRYRVLSEKALSALEQFADAVAQLLAHLLAVRDEFMERDAAIRVSDPALHERHRHDRLFRHSISQHPIITEYLAR